MPSHENLGLQEPSTVTAVVATVVITRGSTDEHQEILVLGDPDSSNGLASVLNAAPASTAWALSVRQVGYVAPSTTAAVSSVAGVVAVSPVSTASMRVAQSSAADLNVTVAGYVAPSTVVTVSTGSVRVHQSTAGDLNVTVAGYVAPSTTVQVSSLAGVVLVSPVSTASVRVTQSTAADLNVTVAGYVAPSTTVNVSSVAGVVAVSPVSTASVRVAQSSAADLLATVTIAAPWDSTFISGTKASTGDTTLFSSAASTRWAVYGYMFSVASTSPVLVRLLSGSTVEMARWLFQGPSSIAVGANLSVPMPAYLYRTAASAGLVLNTDSTVTLHYSVQAYRMS